MQRGEVVGIPSLPLRTGFGRNGAGNPRNNTRAGSTLVLTRLSTRLKILFRITEPTSGRAEIARKFDEIAVFAETRTEPSRSIERFLDASLR